MKVENYIGELLQWHDCVIVPGLGGFISNYAPARINPEKNIFSPPSKNIAFNINLKNSDGLLVSHLATKENIPFGLASKIVSDQVANWCATLNKGRKISLKNIGKIYFDKELNVQFEPAIEDNLLLDSFGLVEFHSPAIKRETLHKKIEKQFKDRPAVRQKTGGIKWKKVTFTILSIPLLAAMAILPLQRDLYYNISMEYSNLNPFNRFESPQYQPRETLSISPVENKFEEAVSDDLEPEIAAGEINNNEVEIETVVLDAEPVLNTEETKAAHEGFSPVSEKQGYFIIGGCFSIEENAENFVADLKNKGYQARIVDQNKGLFRVCYGSFSSREAATDALLKIKNENSGAWVLKK